MEKYTLELNEYGNVNGIPDGWVKTKKRTTSLDARGIPNYKACLGFEKNGRYVKPILVTIIPAEFAEKADEIKPKPQKTEEQKIEAWCRRLDKLTGCGIEEASAIAQEKLDYQHEQIVALEEKNAMRYSEARYKLLEEIRRSNPLRRIEDEGHANAIMIARMRHQDTDYEKRLKIARGMANAGIVSHEEAYYLARSSENAKQMEERIQ